MSFYWIAIFLVILVTSALLARLVFLYSEYVRLSVPRKESDSEEVGEPEPIRIEEEKPASKATAKPSKKSKKKAAKKAKKKKKN